MNPAKIRLSPTEMELVNDAELILTKNAILRKVAEVLGALQVNQQAYMSSLANRLPEKVSGSSPKISKGENYKGLPYLILDFPRVFEREDIFAVRTMFWWGNFFSVTLHLSGNYKKAAEEKLIAAYPSLKEKGYYYCINEDQWAHHFEENNYMPLHEINKNDPMAIGFEKSVRTKPFVKLAKKMALNHWNEAEEMLLETFKEIISV